MTAMVVGIVIGSGVFFKTDDVLVAAVGTAGGLISRYTVDRSTYIIWSALQKEISTQSR